MEWGKSIVIKRKLMFSTLTCMLSETKAKTKLIYKAIIFTD